MTGLLLEPESYCLRGPEPAMLLCTSALLLLPVSLFFIALSEGLAAR